MPEPVDVVAAVDHTDPGPATLTVEELGAAAAAVALEDWQILALDSDGAWLLDERTGERSDLTDAAFIAGTWQPDGVSLLALNGALHQLEDGMLAAVSFDGVPAERLEAGHDEALLWGAGRLYRIAAGTARRVAVSDAETIHDFATTSSTLWLTTPALIGVDAESLAVTDHHPDLTTADIAADGAGTLWVIDADGGLWARRASGDWVALTLAAPAVAVFASPHAPDAWIRTEAGALHHRDGVVSSADVPAGDWQDVDATGRLLIADGSALWRVAHRRPVAFAGHRNGDPLTRLTEVTLLPSDPDTLTSLAAWLDTTPLTIEDGAVWLDPDEAAGPLRVRAEGSEGVTLTTMAFTDTTLPDATWEDDIAPLSSSRCESCHDAATAFALTDAAAWQEHIEAILVSVSTGEMPVGGPALSDDEIQLIRGWRIGGYP